MRTTIELTYSLGNGGIETLVKDYCQNFKFKDKKLVVVTFVDQSDTRIYKEIEKANVKIDYLFKRNGLLYKIIDRFFPFIFALLINKKVKKYNAECVHAHINKIEIFNFILKKISNIKLVWTIHSDPYVNFYLGSKKRVKQVRKIINKKKNFTIVAISKKIQEILVNDFKFNNTMLLYNGINIDKFLNSNFDKTSIRKQFGLGPKDFVIGNVGRFVEAKNHHFILSIFESAKRINKSTKLLLVGEGPLEGQIKSLAKKMNLDKDIIFLSNRNDMEKIYHCLDILLLPSIYEGFGIVLIEAQVCGVVCVASNVIGEDVNLGLAHLLDLNERPEVWANKIFDVFDKKNEVNFKEFDINENCKVLDKLYFN